MLSTSRNRVTADSGILALPEGKSIGGTALFNLKVEYKQPKSEFERILQFHRMVLLMNIDKKADKRELNLIRNLGIKMGLNPFATEFILREMNNYKNNLIPPEKLIEVFKQQYN